MGDESVVGGEVREERKKKKKQPCWRVCMQSSFCCGLSLAFAPLWLALLLVLLF
jgi:hypothetical protein